MNAYEAEDKLWKERAELYRHPPRDFAGGFRPIGGCPADFTVIWHHQHMHCFYIERRLVEASTYPGHEIYLGHASTGDLVNWEVHEPALVIQLGTWESRQVVAPYVMFHEGRFIMAYTGMNSACSQNIGLAYSDDLFNWQRSEHNPISPAADTDWAFWRDDGPASCRDPHLNYFNSRIWMNYTAYTKQGATCIALASTYDLENWEDHGPILVGQSDFTEDYPLVWHLESSALLPWRGKWVLFACGKERIGYWVSHRLDQFDYAAEKTLCLQVSGPSELVWVDGEQWLLIGCRWENQYDTPGTVLRFSVFDWARPDEPARVVTDETEIQKWMERITNAGNDT